MFELFDDDDKTMKSTFMYHMLMISHIVKSGHNLNMCNSTEPYIYTDTIGDLCTNLKGSTYVQYITKNNFPLRYPIVYAKEEQQEEEEDTIIKNALKLWYPFPFPLQVQVQNQPDPTTINKLNYAFDKILDIIEVQCGGWMLNQYIKHATGTSAPCSTANVFHDVNAQKKEWTTLHADDQPNQQWSDE